MCIRHDYVQRPKIGMCAWLAGCSVSRALFAPYVFCTCLKVNVFRVYFIYFTFKSTVKYYVRLVFWCWVMLMLLLLLQLNVIHCVWAHTFFKWTKGIEYIGHYCSNETKKIYIGFVCCIQNEIASRLTIKDITDKSSFNATARQKEKEKKYQRTKRYEIFSQIWSTLQRVSPSILALHRFLSHLSH